MNQYPYELTLGQRVDAVLLSSLMKVFPDERPEELNPLALHSVLPGQHFSFQLALRLTHDNPSSFRVNTSIEWEDASPFLEPDASLSVREVGYVPVTLPVMAESDDNYLRKTAGLYPDVLLPLDKNQVKLAPGQWQSLWFEITVPEQARSGRMTVNVWLNEANAAVNQFGFETEAAETRVSFALDILPVPVKPARLKHTEWFHADCLADYYNVPALSEEHWIILERFIAAGAKRGFNMLLTPIFTPPLDTVIGGERTTVQLIDVDVDADGNYSFGFDKFDRWVRMAQAAGVLYFEISHLFTQWGAKAAPKIMANTPEGYRRIFGWDTPAAEGAYGRFLAAFLPLLKTRLDDLGLAGQAVFHISDEPSDWNLPDYQLAKSLVEPYVGDYKIMDALSSFEFYRNGAVSNPIVANDHIEPFHEAQVPGLWTYYCISQRVDVPNRFMAMPSARSRILGWLLYAYKLEGFLQWGYNFYNTQYSLKHINPFLETGAGKSFMAGDAFIVYPGEDGEPWESLRMVVMGDTQEDLAALQALDELRGEGAGDRFIQEELGMTPTMTDYPQQASTLLSLRQKLNEELAAAAGSGT